MRIVVDVIALHGISHVEVVGQVRVFACHCWDALHSWQDAKFLAVSTNGEVFLLHVASSIFEDKAGNLEVGETVYFSLTEHIGRDVLDGVVAFQLMFVVNDILEFFDEPRVNLGQFVDAVDGVAFLQSLSNGKDAEISRVRQFVVKVVELGVVVAHKTVHALTNHAESLLDEFFEGATDGHDFTHRLHAGTNLAAHTHKLGQVPTWNLADEVVE